MVADHQKEEEFSRTLPQSGDISYQRKNESREDMSLLVNKKE